MTTPPLPPGPPPARQSDVSQDEHNSLNPVPPTSSPHSPIIAKPADAKDPIAVLLKEQPDFDSMSAFERYTRYMELKALHGDDVEVKPAGPITPYADEPEPSQTELLDDPELAMNHNSRGRDLRKERAMRQWSKGAIRKFRQKKLEKRSKKREEWLNS